MMKPALSLAFACLMAGCASNLMRANYRMPLESVQRPAAVEERWGEYRVAPADTSGFIYSDDLVNVAVVPEGGLFYLLIHNQSEHTVELVWNSAAYVGPDGLVSRVNSGDTRVMDLGRDQPNQSIPAGARLSVTALPVSLYEQTYGINRIRDFVPFVEDAPRFEASEIRLVLPLMVEGVVNEYTFVFAVRDLKMPMSEGCTFDRYIRQVCSQ